LIKIQLKKPLILSITTAIILSVLVMYVMAQSNNNYNPYKNDRIEIVAGWNAMPIFSSFVGKSLNEIAHTGQEGAICQDVATNDPAWLYNNTDQKWTVVQNMGGTIDPRFNPMGNFTQGAVWELLWINSKNNCTLGCGILGCMSGGRASGSGEGIHSISVEGVPHIWSVGGIDYEITAEFVDANSVVFTINGENSGVETTGALNEFDSYLLSDGSRLTVIELFTDNTAGGINSVEFTLYP